MSTAGMDKKKEHWQPQTVNALSKTIIVIITKARSKYNEN